MVMAHARLAAALAALALLSSAPAFAQVLPPVGPFEFFASDRTVKTALPPDGVRDGIIGFERLKDGTFEGESSPTVTFAADGSYRFNLFVYHGSKLVVDGGSVYDEVMRNRVTAFDESMTTLTSGRIYQYQGFANSRFVMTGGTVRGAVIAYDSASLSITGGSLNVVQTLDNGTATVSGVELGGLRSNGGTAAMAGGRVSDDLGNGEVTAAGGSTINLSDVVVDGAVIAQ